MPQPEKLTEADEALIKEVEAGLDRVALELTQARFQIALRYAMTLSARVNVYLGTEQPWHTIKTDRARAGTVLYVALRCVDNLKTMLTPFLPFSSQRLHRMLGYDDVIAPQPQAREFSEDGTAHLVLTGDYPEGDRWHPSQLEPGRALRTPEPLFKRLEDVVEQELPASS